MNIRREKRRASNSLDSLRRTDPEVLRSMGLSREHLREFRRVSKQMRKEADSSMRESRNYTERFDGRKSDNQGPRKQPSGPKSHTKSPASGGSTTNYSQGSGAGRSSRRYGKTPSFGSPTSTVSSSSQATPSTVSYGPTVTYEVIMPRPRRNAPRPRRHGHWEQNVSGVSDWVSDGRVSRWAEEQRIRSASESDTGYDSKSSQESTGSKQKQVPRAQMPSVSPEMESERPRPLRTLKRRLGPTLGPSGLFTQEDLDRMQVQDDEDDSSDGD